MGIEPLRVGIVGCGNISGIYFQNLSAFPGTQVVACADLAPERAQEAGAKYSVRAMSTEALMATEDVELVLNLTIPAAHAGVALGALRAGKHVYSEKPLAVSREDGARVLAEGAKAARLVGCAPDTFLGAALQTCRELLDQGAIGPPVAAHAFMLCHGHESWHPSPEFYYEPGGGPMFDMGPYYLTALVALLGPIRRVTGSTRITFPTRTITSEPKRGDLIEVQVPTHVAGIMEFASGTIAEITTSFDVWHSKLPSIAIYGSEGTMIVPDPNGFGGEVLVRSRSSSDWEARALTHPFAGNSRGIGVLDMGYAIAEGRPHRASGDLAQHVLEAMHAFHESAESGRHIVLESQPPQPAPLARDSFTPAAHARLG